MQFTHHLVQLDDNSESYEDIHTRPTFIWYFTKYSDIHKNYESIIWNFLPLKV